MKTTTALLVLALALLLTPACEQHKWDETKQLFKGGEHGGGEHGGEHGKVAPEGGKKPEGAKH